VKVIKDSLLFPLQNYSGNKIESSGELREKLIK